MIAKNRYVKPSPPEAAPNTFIFIGYDHAGIIGCLRPDVAYPDRKIKAGTKVHTTITAMPCDCGDERGHVEVFVRRVT